MARTCRCGCGEPVNCIRRSKQFVDDSHRQRARRRRAAEPKESKPKLEVAEKEPARPDPFDEDAPGWREWPESSW